MNVLHVTQPKSRVFQENHNLMVKLPDGSKRAVPYRQLAGLVLYPGTHLTDPAKRMLATSNIVILRVKKTGEIVSITHGYTKPNLNLFRQQLSLETNPLLRLHLGQEIAYAKMRSQMGYLLLRESFARRRGRKIPQLIDAARKIEALIGKLPRAESLNQLRGLEGQSSKIYFSALGEVLRLYGIPFKGRKYRPAPDKVNAALSFGYYMLHNYVLIATTLVGLLPAPGIVHEDHTHNPYPLVYDLMEELRVAVVDATVIKLVLNNHIRAKQSSPSNHEVRLDDDERKRVIEGIVERLGEKFKDPHSEETLPLQRIIHQQASRLARAIEKESDYQPFYLLGRKP